MSSLFSPEGAGGLIILLWFGLLGGVVAKIKGDTVWVWFLISLCVPVIGLITAILYRNEGAEMRRRCPSCHRALKLYDAVCMGCGCELEFPDTALAPEAIRQGPPRRGRWAGADR